MKAKFLFILLSILFIAPTERLIAKSGNNSRARVHYHTYKRNYRSRSLEIFNMSVQDENGVLQILFQSSLPDAEITVTDKDGNTIIDESQTSIYEGKMLYIYTPDSYPYTIRITSLTLDVMGEIVQDNI